MFNTMLKEMLSDAWVKKYIGSLKSRYKPEAIAYAMKKVFSMDTYRKGFDIPLIVKLNNLKPLDREEFKKCVKQQLNQSADK